MLKTTSWLKLLALVGGLAVLGTAGARPVVYTLRTVADGQLGSYQFTEALLTIRLTSDTAAVRTGVGSLGGSLFTNRAGKATVSITQHGRTVSATFNAGEVYVRYDTGAGIAGFGSSISPTYPVALGCENSLFDIVPLTYLQDCLYGDWLNTATFGTSGDTRNGTLNALADAADIPGDSAFLAAAVLALPQNLTQSTLLTAQAHSCAGPYSVYESTYGSGSTTFYSDTFTTCPSPAARGLRTDRGLFYLQDTYGISEPNYSNQGSLQIEVMDRTDD